MIAPKPCPDCHGTGVVPEGDGDYEGVGYHEIDCPRCAGGGVAYERGVFSGSKSEPASRY